MKKLILSFSLIISFAFYAFWVSSRTQAIAQVSSQPNVELGVVPVTGTKGVGTSNSSGKTVTNTPKKPLVKKSSGSGATATTIIPGTKGTAGVTIKYASSGSTGQSVSKTPASGQNNPVAYNPTPVSTPTPTVAQTPPPVAAQTPVQTGQFKDGSYTGPAVDVYYGNVQVSATISGGRLTDVQFLQYPNDRGSSMQRSMMAMPILKSEAITTQSATVDAVSGATETSKGFVSSLGSALALATN
jgi:uncharacterized protein with FMN-binding domain